MTPDSVYDHPEYRTWIATIAANHDEDVPRLMCADWLTDHGEDDRAEFIRVQCELARTPKVVHYAERHGKTLSDYRCEWCNSLFGFPSDEPFILMCPKCKEGRTSVRQKTQYAESTWGLNNREQELWKSLHFLPETVGAWTTLGVPANYSSQFSAGLRRGFVERITGPTLNWLTHADAITPYHPVKRVKLTTPIHWHVVNYDMYLSEYHDGIGRTTMRRCKVMDPDGVDRLLQNGDIHAVLRHEWPGIAFDLRG
jgi:uncharacterized protein (TIGR02996 family)